MPDDAIVGARYEDHVFDSEFTVVDVQADTDRDVANDDEVTVVLDYETIDGEMEVSLRTFRSEDTISVVQVPAHAGN